MTSAVETILTDGNFPQLRRACIHRIKSLKSNLPHKLISQILQTSSMNELLDMLAQSEYWNWLDTRLLEALTYASGSPEAIEFLEHFKNTFYPRKISEFIPYQLIKPFKQFINLKDKFDKDPNELTVYELLEHKYKLETEVLDIDEGELVLSCIKTGCVELTWQIPQELIYRAYTSMKRKCDELSSLAIKSVVCEEADELAGLSILWRGQEVGEVGPIEPLPEHVRQEPYSLQQGFYWVTLNYNDVEEVVKYASAYAKAIDKKISGLTSNYINSFIGHPNTKEEWHFGIRTINGKLVGIVLAYPLCMSIGGGLFSCTHYLAVHHPKYRNRRMQYVLIKELVRRVNLNNINHLVLPYTGNSSVIKPVSTTHEWDYFFNHNPNSQLPSSPRTPGWRRMTSEDIPSALTLINKWSSQCEIRQVFNSEEEFTHKFLCPTMPNHVFTYVVENETNNITDLVSNVLINVPCIYAVITTVVSTQSPVEQLIIDALVCARENGAKYLKIYQFDIKPDVLVSLSFHYSGLLNFSVYNYRYHEIPETKFWCLAA